MIPGYAFFNLIFAVSAQWELRLVGIDHRENNEADGEAKGCDAQGLARRVHCSLPDDFALNLSACACPSATVLAIC